MPLCFYLCESASKRDYCTCVWTGAEVTGAIFDAKTIAVFASVLRNRVVALPPGQLNSSTARSWTFSKRAPLPPPPVHLWRVKHTPCGESGWKWNEAGHDIASPAHLNVDGAVLISTDSLVADFAVTTAGAIRPGEVPCLADQLAAGLPSAPQFGARLHVRAGLGARAEGELTLAMQVVAGTRQVVWQRQLFLGLVQ